ncbi:MAG: hypothetical protein IH840_07995 [Candidatus Heimdallarchaeota archaeon]|nr:hypothetical protein [Candidatus Heimdallarchaeota archaeon]
MGDNIDTTKVNIIDPSKTYIAPNVVLGKNVTIYPFASIGTEFEHPYLTPHQDWTVHIGQNTVIREGVTINSGNSKDTVIGENCYLMAKSHIGHDASLSSGVVLSPGAVIGGHTQIDNNVTIGINASIHQRKFVGAYSMVGMNSPVSKNILPFTIVLGNPARWSKINELALSRANIDISKDDLTELSQLLQEKRFEEVVLKNLKMQSAWSKYWAFQKTEENAFPSNFVEHR